MKKVELSQNPAKLNIDIPLSGGIKFNLYYENGQTPLEGATILIKSHDGQEQKRGIIDTYGESMRYWLQSTNHESQSYTAEIYFDDYLLHTVSNVKIQQGLSQDLKIVVPVPKMVEDLLNFRLYDSNMNQLSKINGIYSVSLIDKNNNSIAKSEITSRGLVYFSNIPSGIYTAKILKDGQPVLNWNDEKIAIIGDKTEFDLIQTVHPEHVSEPKIVESTYSFGEPESYESSAQESILSCNCVAFRLDDVQDWWLNDVQIELINIFSENNIPLTVGIIADDFGNDPVIVDYIKNELNKDNIQIANHGLIHEPISNFDKQEQNEMMIESNKKIGEILNVTPKIFIPPENKFNEDTIEVLKQNGFTHLTAAWFSDSPPYLEENKSFYRFPQFAETGSYDSSQNRIIGIPANQTFTDVVSAIEKNGFAVITMHPQEFAIFDGGESVNIINEEQIKELKNLINMIRSENISILHLGEIQYNMFKVTDDKLVISSESYVIPKWIKNNAGWWRDGHLDDSSFVNGIQFLINEGIMEIPPTHQGLGGTDIPPWVKNNAGWWAENRISDDDFVNGITYLVNQGIIVV